MILSRVLPQVHFSLFDMNEMKKVKLDEEVEIMLKASICNLGVELNANINTESVYYSGLDEYINYYHQLYLNNNLCCCGQEFDLCESSLNTIVDQINKDTRDASSSISRMNICNSDDCPQKDLNNSLNRQHGKSDLFYEKVYEIKNNHISETNHSCILTNDEEKDGSSSLKHLKDGFKVLTPNEKATIFDNKRDDLFYKTFGRDVRKYLQDDFTAFTKYQKDCKGKDGRYFYECLVNYAEQKKFHYNTNVTLVNIVCYLGSLINHREFKKACPPEYIDLSYQVYNTFNLFTKERLFNLCCSDEFKLLFRYYVGDVSQESCFKRLKNHKTIGANLAPYLFVYNEFCRVCLV